MSDYCIQSSDRQFINNNKNPGLRQGEVALHLCVQTGLSSRGSDELLNFPSDCSHHLHAEKVSTVDRMAVAVSTVTHGAPLHWESAQTRGHPHALTHKQKHKHTLSPNTAAYAVLTSPVILVGETLTLTLRRPCVYACYRAEE